MAIDLDKLFKKAAKKKELDFETAEVLSNVYFNKKSNPIEDRIQQYVELLRNDLRANKQDGIDRILLTLSGDGDLYAKPKQEHCYPMKKSGLRLNIIRFLIGKNDFVPGEDITIAVNASYGSTTFAIRKINEISRRLIHLPNGKDHDLIISKPRGGYKLNPLYPIAQE